jgi:hypothetical protein
VGQAFRPAAGLPGAAEFRMLCHNFNEIVLQSSMATISRVKSARPRRFQETLAIAQQTGLLRGAKTEVVRGRMPKALVRKAKAVSGARSDTELIELALANLALADQYSDWLLSQRGTVAREIDLEF